MERGDAEIVREVLAGDRERFRLLVERYHRAVLASARQILGDAELAQDAAQETFIEAYRALANLKDPEKFRAWLYGILRHRCLKVRAAAGPPTLPFDERCEPILDAWEMPDDEPASVVASLRHLSPEDRELLAARYLHELSYTEIAVALRITCGAVRVRCLRARERLRQVIARTEAAEHESPRCERTTVIGTTR
jgi:RNA polymerase sigma-70 factor (ECF subfamily)